MIVKKIEEEQLKIDMHIVKNMTQSHNIFTICEVTSVFLIDCMIALLLHTKKKS